MIMSIFRILIPLAFSTSLMLASGRGDDETIPTSPERIRPILIGQKIPQLTLTTIEGIPYDVNLESGKKSTILIFYRGGWCPFCNRHLAQLRHAEPELAALGYQLLAVSPDRPSKLRETVNKNELSYTLLSDSSMTASKALGIAYKVDERVVNRYRNNGTDFEEFTGEDHHLLPVPAVFIIGKDGTVRFHYINPNYRVRLDPDLLLAAARASLQ